MVVGSAVLARSCTCTRMTAREKEKERESLSVHARHALTNAVRYECNIVEQATRMLKHNIFVCATKLMRWSDRNWGGRPKRESNGKSKSQRQRTTIFERVTQLFTSYLHNIAVTYRPISITIPPRIAACVLSHSAHTTPFYQRQQTYSVFFRPFIRCYTPRFRISSSHRFASHLISTTIGLVCACEWTRVFIRSFMSYWIVVVHSTGKCLHNLARDFFENTTRQLRDAPSVKTFASRIDDNA